MEMKLNPNSSNNNNKHQTTTIPAFSSLLLT